MKFLQALFGRRVKDDQADYLRKNVHVRKPLYDDEQLDRVLDGIECLKYMVLAANKLTGGRHSHKWAPSEDREFNWEKHGMTMLKLIQEDLEPFVELLHKVHPHRDCIEDYERYTAADAEHQAVILLETIRELNQYPMDPHDNSRFDRVMAVVENTEYLIERLRSQCLQLPAS
jgi:hypothetical protein